MGMEDMRIMSHTIQQQRKRISTLEKAYEEVCEELKKQNAQLEKLKDLADAVEAFDANGAETDETEYYDMIAEKDAYFKMVREQADE